MKNHTRPEFKKELEELVRNHAATAPQLGKIAQVVYRELTAFEGMSGWKYTRMVDEILKQVIKEKIQKCFDAELSFELEAQIRTAMSEEGKIEYLVGEAMRHLNKESI